MPWLTSKRYADARRADISSDQTTDFTAGVAPRTDGEGACTTHLTVVDNDGAIVSATQTLNGVFGARAMVTGTGMMLNNCMSLMDPTPGRTNSIAPGKRVLSSMSPTIVERDGKPWFALGTPGGNQIFAAVSQAILNVVDHGMSLQQAVDAPRVWTMGLGSPVLVEDTFAKLAELVAGLERLGHRVESGRQGRRWDERRAHRRRWTATRCSMLARRWRTRRYVGRSCPPRLHHPRPRPLDRAARPSCETGRLERGLVRDRRRQLHVSRRRRSQ